MEEDFGYEGTKDSQGKHGMFVRLAKEEYYGATCWSSKKNQGGKEYDRWGRTGLNIGNWIWRSTTRKFVQSATLIKDMNARLYVAIVNREQQIKQLKEEL